MTKKLKSVLVGYKTSEEKGDNTGNKNLSIET